MKFLALSALVVCFAGHAFAKGSGCPAVVQDPKQLVCQTTMKYFGQLMSTALVVDLKPAGFKNWEGSVDFKYPNVSSGTGAANTLKATVSIETHGNGRCQQWNEYSLDLAVLGFNLNGLTKTSSIDLKDGLGGQALKLDMACTVN